VIAGGECRGEAPEGGRAPIWRAAALKASADGDICWCARQMVGSAPFGASPPFFAGGESLRGVVVGKTSGVIAPRERFVLFTPDTF